MISMGGGNNGGGGGLGGLLGGLLDPLGLFSGGGQSKGGDPLSKLFDPLGLFPMLQGEIAKAQGNPADTLKVSQMAMEASQLNAAEPHAGLSDEQPHGGEAKTEVNHGHEPKGYAGAGEADDAPAPNDDGPSHDTSAPPNAPSAPQGSSDAQKAADAERARRAEELKKKCEAHQVEMKHLSTLVAYLPTISGGDGDRKFNRDNLRACLFDPNDSRFPKELQEAAKYVLDNPEVLTQLILQSAAGNQCMTDGGVELYMAKRQALLDAELAAAGKAGSGKPASGSAGAGAKSGAAGSKGPSESHGAKGSKGAEPVGKNVSYGEVMNKANKAAEAHFNKKSASIESRLMEGGGAYIKTLDKEIEALLTRGDLDSADMQKIQMLMQKRTEMYQLVSNIMNMFHQMSMTPINNLR